MPSVHSPQPLPTAPPTIKISQHQARVLTINYLCLGDLDFSSVLLGFAKINSFGEDSSLWIAVEGTKLGKTAAAVPEKAI